MTPPEMQEKSTEELNRIAKDKAFYSFEVRYQALKELEKRNALTNDLIFLKQSFEENIIEQKPKIKARNAKELGKITEYQLSIISCLRVLWFPLFALILLLPILAYNFRNNGDSVIIISLLAITLIVILPNIILLINHCLKSANYKIIIDDIEKTVSILNRKGSNTINYSEIEKIKIIGQRATRNDFLFRNVSGDFYYYHIVLKNNKVIKISRLVVRKLEHKIRFNEFRYEYKFFPIIK